MALGDALSTTINNASDIANEQQPNLQAAPSTPQFVNNAQTNQQTALASRESANKDIADPSVRARYAAGQALDNFLKTPVFNSALTTLSKYAGMIGRSKAEIVSKLDIQGGKKKWEKAKVF